MLPRERGEAVGSVASPDLVGHSVRDSGRFTGQDHKFPPCISLLSWRIVNDPGNQFGRIGPRFRCRRHDPRPSQRGGMRPLGPDDPLWMRGVDDMATEHGRLDTIGRPHKAKALPLLTGPNVRAGQEVYQSSAPKRCAGKPRFEADQK